VKEPISLKDTRNFRPLATQVKEHPMTEAKTYIQRGEPARSRSECTHSGARSASNLTLLVHNHLNVAPRMAQMHYSLSGE
jgi:hypothetical protein